MLSRVDKDKVINKVDAWVSERQRGKNGINKRVTYIRCPDYFETAVQACIVILNQAEVEGTQMVATMLKGTDKVRERVHSISEGMECYNCRL